MKNKRNLLKLILFFTLTLTLSNCSSETEATTLKINSKFTLKAKASIKIGDSAKNSDVYFYWFEGRGVWNNSESDPADLYDANNKLVSSFKD